MAAEDSRLIARIDRLVSLFEDGFRERGGFTARIAAGSKSFSGSRSRTREALDFDELETNIKDLAKQLGESEESFKDIDSLTKLIHKRFSGLAKDTEQSAQAFRILNALVKNSASTLEDLEEGAEDASANIWRFASSLDHNTLASKQFSSNLAKSIVNTAVFNSALFANSDVLKENTRMYDSATKGVRDAAKKLNAGILGAVDVYDKVTGELKSFLMMQDFARLNLSVANISATIDDAAQKLELKNGISELLNYSDNRGMLSNALAGDSEFKSGIDALILKMKAAGVDITHHFEDATDETANYAKAIEEIVQIHKNNSEVLEEFEAVATQAGTALGGFTMKIQHSSASIKDWVDANISSSDAIRANASNFGSSLLRITDQLQDFNISMLPETFANVQLKAMEMGMTFEETTQFLQANRSLYAMQGGADGFEALREQLMDAYARQGFNEKQSAAMMASDIELAKSGGVDIRDPQVLSTFIEQTAKGFKQLSSVIAITHEEYTAALESINSSTEMSAALYGLDEKRANALRLSNAAQYENYRLMGLSNEQAQSLTQAAARRNREGIASKFADGARAALLASQVGMDPEKVRRLQQLSMKSYIAPGSQDEKDLVALRQELGQKVETSRQAAADSGDPQHAMKNELINSLIGGMSQDAQTQIETGVTVGMRDRSNAQISQEEQEAMAAAAEPSQAVRVLTDTVNTVRSIMDNAFVGALFAGSGALLGLFTPAVYKAAMALKMLGGGGGGDPIPGRRGRRGRGGGGGRGGAGRTPPPIPASPAPAGEAARGGAPSRIFSPTNLKAGAGGALGLATAIGGGMLVDHLASNGTITEDQAKVAGAGLGIAGMAGTGAAIGSFIFPGVGTAIGAGLGGLAGAAMNWDDGGKDLVQGLAKWSPMGLMARAGEHTAGLTDSIFGTNTQESSAGINQSIFGSRFTEPDSPATTPTSQEVKQQAQQDQPATESTVNRNALSTLGPDGLDPIQTLIQQLGPEKLAEAFATALAGVRITLYNPNSATTSLGYISGRQSS